MKKLQQLILSRWFWLIALVVFAVSRISTFLFPYDSDHWIFYYIGRRWVDGATLYVDMWDHKSPLIYLYNGALHILFGGNIWAHRIIFAFIALLVLWLFYKTTLLLYKAAKINNYVFVARITTLLFAFLANLSEFTNSGNNNENLGLIFLISTLYLYLKYRQNNKKQYLLLLSGVLAGFVFLLKANFAILLLPIVIDLVITHRKDIHRLVGGLAIFAFGTLLQLLGWALYFKSTGTFKHFYIASFEFNSKYIKALGWDFNAPGIKIFIGILLLLLIFFAPFLARAMCEFRHPNKNTGYLIPLLALSSILLMVAAGTFYSHYFLIAIPYLCLMFGVTAHDVFRKHRALKITILSTILLLLLLISFKQLYNNYYGSTSLELKSQKAAAQYIESHTTKNDKIFANLYGATFYQLANRDSGSRFISASHPLIDYKYKFGYDFNKTFILDMEYSEVKYIVMS
ncbi:MAG: glycosyltransferase family 39 protein, partial [Candidatus Saccharibacteria bacterium]